MGISRVLAYRKTQNWWRTRNSGSEVITTTSLTLGRDFIQVDKTRRRRKKKQLSPVTCELPLVFPSFLPFFTTRHTQPSKPRPPPLPNFDILLIISLSSCLPLSDIKSKINVLASLPICLIHYMMHYIFLSPLSFKKNYKYNLKNQAI